jgi:aryl-alcohol dehydrogenase-like predicted oxidoreductase
MVSLSLNWLLHPTAADCIILGLSSMEQLNQNLAAGGDGPLPEDVVKSCNRAARNR